MTVEYLKRASRTPSSDRAHARAKVEMLLDELEERGEEAVERYNQEFDGWTGDVVVPRAVIERAARVLPDTVKQDLRFAHQRVRDFAQRQLESIGEFETELLDGLVVGQRLIPVHTAGCYVPGGRYAHAASAIMSVCTARVAGVKTIIAATPAHGDHGIHPAILYALDLAGVDRVLAAGGVQGIAALAFGLFTGAPADIIVGPGNRFVAEAKRVLFGRVGIDLFAGPTECLVIADENADADIVTADLIGQAEHGSDSPVWLVTTSRAMAGAVLAKAPAVIAALPQPAQTAAREAWRDYAEVALVDSREEAVALSDRYAPEHLQVQAGDLDWWLAQLSNYGSLFLGEETTVAFGDKCSGPNHILPTMGAARYTGGLSVGKFIKTLTYQRLSRAATETVAPVAARISRLEGMEGHARTADIRLEKYFPDGGYVLEPELFDRPGEDAPK